MWLPLLKNFCYCCVTNAQFQFCNEANVEDLKCPSLLPGKEDQKQRRAAEKTLLRPLQEPNMMARDVSVMDSQDNDKRHVNHCSLED